MKFSSSMILVSYNNYLCQLMQLMYVYGSEKLNKLPTEDLKKNEKKGKNYFCPICGHFLTPLFHLLFIIKFPLYFPTGWPTFILYIGLFCNFHVIFHVFRVTRKILTNHFNCDINFDWRRTGNTREKLYPKERIPAISSWKGLIN